ncbi:TetR/AcrR family transcriptional regulator [Nocardia cyriacigeorgica]|uniref:TetR/AcrR family transcriptional regulator n=1 Tax=Nocardia cyriacigeorgica TaxID=135487 RepID=UPI0013D62566|nr:TetR/AcrR family transcriptional regulator [Nocardia cyriacigeorgica]NEW26079.1 TetR/AcrR family transcriptional regulator [Nocardia cyriacigeorgica]
MAYVKATEREGQIVAAAIQVLGEVGVGGITTRAVAVEAGIPLGTLHYVFPTKDQMLRAVITTVVDDAMAAARAGLELDQGVEHAIRHGVTNFWDTLVEGEPGLQVMQYELAMYSVRSEGPGGLARLLCERYATLVAEFCETAARASGERCAVDFGTLGRLTFAVVDGLIMQHVTDPDLARSRRDLEQAVEMIVGFADPRPVSR